jgi:hypothetical protein
LQSTYQPELWQQAYIVLGGATAALAGLIMVAASVRADQIMGAPHWRLRAQNSTLAMISITVASILVLLPQERFALGAELIVLNLACAVWLPGRLALYQLLNRVGVALYAPVLAVVLYFLAAVGGASLIVGWGGGMYLVTAAYIVFMFLAISNAYVLMLPQREPPKV